MKVLGIETSCDETAAAVYCDNHVASNVWFSQIDLHRNYGGVVPELASRSHIEKIAAIVDKALQDAGCSLDDIDAIAVTNRPGLPGSLLVGVCFAKALAFAASKPIIGVDHIEGHIFSVCIEQDMPFPFLCLTASGGHTSLFYVQDYGKFTKLGTTKDDAAGEAFDKISKILGLGYPGGPQIEALARKGEYRDYRKYPRLRKRDMQFSFSGLKTAVVYDMIRRQEYDLERKLLTISSSDSVVEIASSLLVAVGDIFVQRIEVALIHYPSVKGIAFVGGVACNQYLRKRIITLAAKNGLVFGSPSPQYCTDNGAMIAFVGHYRACQKIYDATTLDILPAG